MFAEWVTQGVGFGIKAAFAGISFVAVFAAIYAVISIIVYCIDKGDKDDRS